METTTRLAKTDKGREEIEHRRYKLPGKVRTLLILIDGTRTIDEVARDAQKLGAPEDAVLQLMREGFVASVAGGARGAPAGRGLDYGRADAESARGADGARVSDSAHPAAGGERAGAIGAIGGDGSGTGNASGSDGDTESSPVDSDYERFRVAKKFMNDTAVDNMGAMKKFTFTLKLERCAVRTDLAELIDEYEQALTKSIGPEGAAVLVDRLKVLLR